MTIVFVVVRFVRFRQKTSAALAIEMFDGYSIGSAKLAVKYSRTINNNNGTNNGDNYSRQTLIDSTDWDKEDQELAAASKQKPNQNADQTESTMGRSRGRGRMVNNSSNMSEVSHGSRK